jgi:ATP-dependent helicase/nuclease subunit B
MKTVLGPFHPHLERALVDELRRHKADHPLLPVLILVPSAMLRRRLKILLTREQNLSWVNLHLMTFHQLSLRLSSEANGMNPPMLRDDLFFEGVLRQMIRTTQPGTEVFAGIEERTGGCAALWQTLRDLRDGLVEPSVVLEALREDHFAKGTSGRTSHLLALLERLLLLCKNKGIEDQSDLDQLTTARVVHSSRFLGQFVQIFYYGFYDLTQVQVDLFHAVSQSYPTSLFFPLVQTQPTHEGWSFAERFYQRYVQGRIGATNVTNLVGNPGPQNHLLATFRLFDQAAERPYAPLSKNWRCKIMNAFGIHDEVAVVAKEILRLVADEQMSFNEIGVVARSLEAYGPPIKEIFHNHRIPLTGVIEEPLVQFPLTKAVILLLNLPAKDYLRTQVIDLLSSPYFQRNSAGTEKILPRPDMWDLATRELAICKGIHEWRRLESYTTRDLILSWISNDDEPRLVKIAAAQIRYLANIFSELSIDLNSLPLQASWNHYVGAWKELLKKYLGISSDDEEELVDSEVLARAEILAILDRLEGLDLLEANVTVSDFCATLQHWLERNTVAAPLPNADGVAVLDATAARGQPFRTLFILGLNEGVFPRTIREDAFLRDRDREILERDFGFKVNAKLAGFDEEKLVFTLLVNAARERLYCLFQRADESGRALAPSWYLTELRRALENHAEYHLEESTIPRSIADKTHTEPFDRVDLLLPEELAVRLSLDNRDPTTLIEAFNLSPLLYKQGREAVERLELTSAALGAFDGVVGPLSDYWRYFSQRGLSPTALETYSRCPFQFFARHVLGLERLERPEEIIGPSAAEFGELGHSILRSIYQELVHQDYFASKTVATDIESTLTTVAQRTFAEYASKNPVGYPLAWEILQEGLIEVLRQVLARDLEEIWASGYAPVALETDAKEQLGPTWPQPLNGQTIRGRMDRIDRDRTRNRLRIIDYKFKFGVSSRVQDKDLYRAALRGEKLQPPFYFLLGKRWAAEDKIQASAPEVEAHFYYIAPRWSGGPLVTASFGSTGFAGPMGEEMRSTISYLAQGIQNGRFFIQPGDYCQHCDVAEICRKSHPPSLWRAENDLLTEPHRQLRDKGLKKL